MPSWSSLTTSAETGPLQISQISLSNAWGSRAALPVPSTLEMRLGLVVTPSISPCSTQVRISFGSAPSMKNFMCPSAQQRYHALGARRGEGRSAALRGRGEPPPPATDQLDRSSALAVEVIDVELLQDSDEVAGEHVERQASWEKQREAGEHDGHHHRHHLLLLLIGARRGHPHLREHDPAHEQRRDVERVLRRQVLDVGEEGRAV